MHIHCWIAISQLLQQLHEQQQASQLKTDVALTGYLGSGMTTDHISRLVEAGDMVHLLWYFCTRARHYHKCVSYISIQSVAQVCFSNIF